MVLFLHCCSGKTQHTCMQSTIFIPLGPMGVGSSNDGSSQSITRPTASRSSGILNPGIVSCSRQLCRLECYFTFSVQNYVTTISCWGVKAPEVSRLHRNAYSRSLNRKWPFLKTVLAKKSVSEKEHQPVKFVRELRRGDILLSGNRLSYDSIIRQLFVRYSATLSHLDAFLLPFK